MHRPLYSLMAALSLATALAACADEVALRYIPHLPSPYTLDDARWWITEGVPEMIAAGGWSYGIADPETDRIIGGADLSLRPRDTGEIGYWVAPWARGRGVGCVRQHDGPPARREQTSRRHCARRRVAKVRADLDNRAIGPNASISGKAKGGDSYTLTTFGKPARNMNCDCERRFAGLFFLFSFGVGKILSNLC